MNQPSYADLTACTLVPEVNTSYLSQTSVTPAVAPMGGSTMGLMMLLSTFQYQAPYMGPTYSNAASQAGKAAFIQSGGQKMEDGLRGYGVKQAKDAGLTDAEAVVLFGAAKTLRNRQLDFNGPRVYSIKTHLTLGTESGSVGLKYEW